MAVNDKRIDAIYDYLDVIATDPEVSDDDYYDVLDSIRERIQLALDRPRRLRPRYKE